MTSPSPQTLVFRCESLDHEIALCDDPDSGTLRQLRQWLPAEVTIHCAKIAGCHIYWPAPILAKLERATDIHTLQPGSFLYYPDRQYLEIIYDRLQPESAAVNYLGCLVGNIDWLREFATRQRRLAGSQVFTAHLHLRGSSVPRVIPDLHDMTAWQRIQRARHAVWAAEPADIQQLTARTGFNAPFGPMATADGYFRFVQESVWQLWNRPERLSDQERRAAATNSLELGIARLSGYCHLQQSERFLRDALDCISDESLELQDVFAEIILYCGRMSSWVDLHIPWWPLNELTKKELGRHDYE